MVNILYVGDNSPGSTSSHRATALQRLGHNVVVLDPYDAFSKQLNARFLGSLHFRTGYFLLTASIIKWLKQAIATSFKPDIVWVNSGELLGPGSLKLLKTLNCPVVLYNNDDPTGGRDGRRFDQMIKALPYYDLCAVMREVNVNEFKEKGARNVIRVFMSYDEDVHHPFEKVLDIPESYRSDVAFIGTWMRYENRDEFLLELIRQGIQVSIWGNRWQKSPKFSQLEPYWKGSALRGRNYVAAIQGAKICLGMLSKGNRDMHTQRSLEVPYAGGLFCAERTPEHQQLYAEGKEAVYWSDAKECAAICKKLLESDTLREDIRAAGMRKIRAIHMGNEDVCRKILAQIKVASGEPVQTTANQFS